MEIKIYKPLQDTKYISGIDPYDDKQQPTITPIEAFKEKPPKSTITNSLTIRIMKKEKALRIIIDAMIQGVLLIGSSRNLALVKTNLERSKMFLGQVLKEQGEENPFPSSKDSSNAKIEPTADTSDDENELLVSLKKIRDENKPGIALTVKQIKEMRSFMDDSVEELRELIDDHDDAHYELMWKKEALIAFIEAQQWLGMELGAINDSLNGKEAIAQPATSNELPESNNTVDPSKFTGTKDDDDPSGDRA